MIASTCDLCQKTKCYNKPVAEARYFDIPTKPKHLVSVDIFAPITSTKFGFKYTLVIQDVFTKYTKLYCLKRITAKNVVSTITNKYFKSEGMPKILLTDLGRQFIGEEWTKLKQDFNCKLEFTTP